MSLVSPNNLRKVLRVSRIGRRRIRRHSAPPQMEIYISLGEWINTLQIRMGSAVDGDCFYLPSLMHLHAYQLVKDASFPERNFRVELQEESKV